jgi:hypothetical protein
MVRSGHLFSKAQKAFNRRLLEELQEIFSDRSRRSARVNGLSATQILNPIWNFHDEWLLSDAKKSDLHGWEVALSASLDLKMIRILKSG